MSSRKRSIVNSAIFDVVQQLDSEDGTFERQRRKSNERDLKKSRAAQSQTKIFESLVECRILLQRFVSAQGKRDAKPIEQLAELSLTPPPSSQSQKAGQVLLCNKILALLLDARKSMVQLQGNHSGAQSESLGFADSYEHLFSDCDNGQKDEHMTATLQSEYDICRKVWIEVLNRRHRAVQLRSGASTTKFGTSVVEASFWQQVDATVQHEMLRRQRGDVKHLSVFDDTKIYQHMLKDFVSTQGRHSEESAALRLGAQSQRTKRDTVDRRASKGRKIKYTPLPKLVNFSFPQNRHGVQENQLDEDEWFQSIFGGVGFNLP